MTFIPIELSQRASVLVFVSCVLPDKISLPIIRIAALTFVFTHYCMYNLKMEFTKSLIKGKLIKRYKRFFVDIRLDNQVVTAHCPNTGSMKGLLDEGNEAYLLKK